jgi:beta-lactamase class A
MTASRRDFFAAASAALLIPAAARANTNADLAREVIALFQPLPGQKAILISAPATKSAPELTISMRPHARMFVGSAFKAYVLCERLRQLDGPDVVQKLQTNLLPLDASVWVPGSSLFDPPNLSGKAPERTAAEAMIMHSDNTGTDMVMAATNPAEVRKFIADIRLKNTQIPDSIRSFLGYLLGFPDFRHTTWEQLVAADKNNAPLVNPPLNDIETLASSASDLVSFYTRSLQGDFFTQPETLQEFRRILSTADAISRAVPVGASAYAKGGSLDVPGYHAACIAGGMAFSGRWVYYATIINWNAPEQNDPNTFNAFVAATAKAFQTVYDALV